MVDKKTGKEITGKYAVIKGGQVNLYTGIMSDKKGGWRGCGTFQLLIQFQAILKLHRCSIPFYSMPHLFLISVVLRGIYLSFLRG